MRIRRRTLLIISSSFAMFTLTACSGGSAGVEAPPSTTVTSTSAPSATAAVTDISGPPNASNVMRHIEALAGEIGSRPAGSNAEREAAEYIAETLTAAGYEVTTERFTFVGNFDDSHVVLPGDTEIDGFMLDGSTSDNAYGVAVFGGTGSEEDLEEVDVEGNVLVLDRGEIPFAEKVKNAEAAGAIAVVVINNEPGAYQGTLGDHQSSIPVVGVEQAARESLVPVRGNGRLTVIASGGRRERESQNVVGRTEEPCRAYIGAHYDSVQVSPGANDNASGVGLILELARGHFTEGLCIVAFGAEEVGLWGSQAFAESESDALDDVEFVINFDMIGKVTGPVIIGDSELTEAMLDILERGPTGSRLEEGEFPPFASSDHVSFTAVGVRAVTVHSGGDDFIHTAQDDLENVDLRSIETMLRASERALLGLLAAEGIR